MKRNKIFLGIPGTMPKRDLIDASSNIISTLKLIFFLYILKIPNCKLNLKNANKEIKTIVLNFSNSFFFQN